MLGWPKTALAVAEQNRDQRDFGVGYGDIDVAVTIEIAKREVVGGLSRCAGRARRGVEMPSSVAQQDGQQAAVDVDGDNVGMAVMIDVGNGN